MAGCELLIKKCPSCECELHKNETVMICEGVCQRSFHIACQSISTRQYEMILDLGSKIKWYCQECKLRVETHFGIEQLANTNLYENDGLLNKLPSQKWDTFSNLSTDNCHWFLGLINLIFEKTVDQPNFSVAYALLCRELALMQAPINSEADEGKKGTTAEAVSKKEGSPEHVDFRKLLVRKCQLELEKNSIDKSARNVKVELIDNCTNVEKKKELLAELDDYDRKLKMKSMGNTKFIGELFKQNMLTVNVMQQCLSNLLETKDEESLESLCKLIVTIGQVLECEKIDLSPIFNVTKDIMDGNYGKVSRRVRIMVQNVVDSRLSKWVPGRQDLNPKTEDEIKKKTENEQMTMQALNSVPMTLWRDERGASSTEKNSSTSSKKYGNTNNEDGWSTASSRDSNRSFSIQSEKLKSKPPTGDEPLGSSLMFGSWGRGFSIKTQPPMTNTTNMERGEERRDERSAPEPMPLELSLEKMERKFKNIIDEFINNCCNIEECEQDIRNSIPPTVLPQLILAGCVHVLERSKVIRLRTGTLLSHLVKSGVLSAQGYCRGLESVMSEAQELIIDIPTIWESVAELIAPVLWDNATTLRDIYKAFEEPIASNHAHKLLAYIFKLFVFEKGPTFVESLWKNSNFAFTDFMPESQVESFINDNNFYFLVDSSNFAASTEQTLVSYEEIHTKLLAFFTDKSSFDSIINWMLANVGGAVKEIQFIRTLATACFQSSIVSEKLRGDMLEEKYNFFHLFVDTNPTYELQCLFALQSLINKMEHPQGLLSSICNKLYEDNIFSHKSFMAWETNADPDEQEGKHVALMQLTSFFLELQAGEDESASSSSDSDCRSFRIQSENWKSTGEDCNMRSSLNIRSSNKDPYNSKEDANDVRFHLCYQDDQWSPANTDGKKVYPRDFLLALSKDPLSLKRPDNLPADILRNDDKARVGDSKRFLLRGGPDFSSPNSTNSAK